MTASNDRRGNNRDQDRIGLIHAFVYACGFAIHRGERSVSDEPLVQHLVFLAESLGFGGFQYDFVWDNSPLWPISHALTRDFYTMCGDLERLKTTTHALNDEQIVFVKGKVLPLLSSFRKLSITATDWISLLAKIEYMAMHGHSPDEAIETVEQQYGEPAARAAITALAECGLLRSALTRLHGGDAKKLRPR